jgi:hypothetical protein
MVMSVQYYAKFEKKNNSILLTRTLEKRETVDITQDIGHLEDMYGVVGWNNPAISTQLEKPFIHSSMAIITF